MENMKESENILPDFQPGVAAGFPGRGFAKYSWLTQGIGKDELGQLQSLVEPTENLSFLF